jgi:hypothetical protein
MHRLTVLLSRFRLALLAGLLVANAAILLTDISWLRMAAGLALVFILPGLAWLQALNWAGTRCAVERIVLVGGLSAAVSSVALLGAVYWPGPLDLTQVLVALDLVTLIGLAIPTMSEPARWKWPSRRVLIVLPAIVAVAAFLRWYTIGYGEFHEDEIENIRLAVRAMKGEEYALFLDSKGPVHWLLPAALWLTHGWLSETVARSPFAICSLLTVLAVYALGRRMAGPAVGLIGSGLAAVNGFFLAYARHVENPSLIVLWGVLAAWCAYRFYREKIGSLQVLGGLFLGIGLVAHPDVLLYLPPFGFMMALAYWHDRGLWRRHWKSGLVGALVFLTLTLVFYVPFIRDPNFQRAQEYFAQDRIGTQFLYNGLQSMRSQDSDYSTRYYGPLLVLLAGLVVVRELLKFGRRGAWLAAAIVLAAATTVYWPSLWQWGPIDGAFLPYAALFLALTFSSHTSFEVKSLALWFGVPFLAMEFLAKDAADHVQIAYPAWVLLAALGLEFFWKKLAGRSGQILKAATVAGLACILGLILTYQHLEFLGRITDYWSAQTDSKNNAGSIYNILYGDLPRPRKLFSNPRLGGWKVVGYLYDSGELRGDFRSINESFAVPIWYTHQTPRSCFDDPQNYFVEIGPDGPPGEMEKLPAAGYGLTRIVRIDRQPKLYLFEKSVPAASQPKIYDVDDYGALFDLSATPQRYAEEPPAQHPLQASFGGKMLLQGYDINTTQLAPGETLALTLHWQAITPMDIRYRAFVHVETDRMWGQHDDDPICRLRADEWRPGQTGQGQFRVTLDPATPPSTYPVTVGVYNPDNGERLEIADEQGQPLGNVFELTTIVVK